ncbi:MAG TPA: dihydrodipicolinate synthase family protein, partial [Chitinophagaceae bacterium]|nr:dihydrodipicolinate synthase family protein [Chitinophagaceae bacterium]
MKKSKKYSGVIIPAITPLTADHKLDESGVEKIFHFFYEHNTVPFILGTTGESSSLPLSVKEAYVKAAVKNKKAGTLLYAGIASNVINESMEFAKFCADNGVDAVAANLPSYYVLTESQIKKHYELLADACPLPLVIYNIPATTNMSIPLSIIDELSYHHNVVATKDSERNEERLKQSLELWKNREDFSHFLGWAAKSTEALINGSDGLIPSTGNLIPEVYSEMVKAIDAGDHNKAYEMQKLSDVYGSLYQSGKTLGESLWALKVLMK